jgi:type II secretory pathway predicted ATPase ExeA/phage tail protein X
MFLEFYGLTEQPFGVTPDPRFLFFSDGHREALAAMYYAIEERRGFSALVAAPGMGKTSLLFRLLESLQESAKTAFLFQAGDDSKDFLECLVRDLGVSVSSNHLPALHDSLNQMLVKEMDANRRVVVVIDEAQNLSEEMLEETRLLSNFETPAAKMMHIILAGQPGLEERLAKPALTQLRQRVGAIAHLTPLTLKETTAYVEHRLQAAGFGGTQLFTAGAIESISKLSEGIPRNINNICFQAMSLGCVYQKKTIDADIVKEVARDLEVKKERVAPKTPSPTVSSQKPRESAPRVAVQAATWPSFPPAVQAADIGFYGAPYSPEYGSGRTSARGGIGWVVFLFVFLPVLTFAVLNKAGVVNGAALLDRLTGAAATSNSNSSQPGPEALRPPAAPPVEKPLNDESKASSETDASSATNQPVTSHPEEPANSAPNARVIRTTRTQTVKEIAEEYFGSSDSSAVTLILSENPGIRYPYQVLPAGTQVTIPTNTQNQESNLTDNAPKSSSSSKRRNFDLPRTPPKVGRVRVQRDETLFQFAMEQTGKGDWATVGRIRAANPQIRDPYQILERGQWIKIPDENTQR